MQLSERLMDFLNFTNFKLLNSSFIISDLEQVLYVKVQGLDDCYLHKCLSQDIKILAKEWQNQPFSKNLLFISNENLKKIIEEDNVKYSAQMIFPLYKNSQLDGFAFFFRTYGNYVESSAKAPKTIRNNIQKFLDDEYLERNKELEKENRKTNSDSDRNLFTSKDLTYIGKEIRENAGLLGRNLDYWNLDRQMIELHTKIAAIIDNDTRKLILELEELYIQAKIYHNCLAYYVGKGIIDPYAEKK